MTDFVGYRTVTVADPQLEITFPVAVLYPTITPSRPEPVGAFTLDVALQAPIKAGTFPLVVISHGTGSTPWAYRTLAHFLARQGFVVGLPEHPFNNRNDDSWACTVRNLTARPHHLKLALDAFFQHPDFASFLVPDTVGVVGHSMGGYTALALAGGLPTSFPNEAPDGQPHLISTEHDPRIKALVLLAPATPWFVAPKSLQKVTALILLLEAERDEHTTRQHGQIVLDGMPHKEQVTHRIVKNAGHFSFLSPFPPARVSPAFPPSQDPPGFSREQFHKEMNAEVSAFLSHHIPALATRHSP